MGSEQMVKFRCDDLDHRLGTGIVFRIHHYWDIRNVVNGHKSAAHTDSTDGALVRRALAEVCTVPVLLVSFFRFSLFSDAPSVSVVVDNDAGKCPKEPEKLVFRMGAPILWGPVRPNGLSTPKSCPFCDRGLILL